jgi:hypothetical protein
MRSPLATWLVDRGSSEPEPHPASASDLHHGVEATTAGMVDERPHERFRTECVVLPEVDMTARLEKTDQAVPDHEDRGHFRRAGSPRSALPRRRESRVVRGSWIAAFEREQG